MKWKEVPLDELCTVCIDCVNRTAPTVPYPTPFKMIRTSNIKKGFVDVEDVKYVNEETYRRWTRRSTPRRGDVVLTREAPLGSVGRLTTNESIFLGQRIFHYRADPAKLDPDYLAFVLQSPLIQGRIRSKGFGATVEHVQVGECQRLKIPVPPLQIQQRIGKALAAFDDLIENNGQRRALLEEAAAQIHKEWFVRLRFPGHEGRRAVDGVPDGWKKQPVSDWLSNYIGGGWGDEAPDSNHSEPGFVIRGTDIPNVETGNLDRVPFRYHKPSNIRSRLLKDGDLVFEVSGGSKGQPIGRTLLVTDDLLSSFSEPVICASFCKKLRPVERRYSEYLLLHLKFIRDAGLIDVFASQSASNITNFKFTAFLAQHSFLRPPDDVLDRFNDVVGKALKQVRVLGRQNQQLSEARDLLLPRLMSGEIEV